MESLTLQPIARVDGAINLPGSKSVSNRALLLAALACGKTALTNLLDSDDVRHMLNALSALGSITPFLPIAPAVISRVMAAHYVRQALWNCFSVMPEPRCVR